MQMIDNRFLQGIADRELDRYEEEHGVPGMHRANIEEAVRSFGGGDRDVECAVVYGLSQIIPSL